jgi:hypothetical protein
MPATPPIAAPVTPSLGAPTPAGPPPDAPRENMRSPERQIFDYAIELQEAALNDSRRLANPAALVGEAVEGFRKFFEKSRRVSRFPNEQSKPHEAPVIAGASTTTSEVHSTLHRGPAQESLEPSGTNYNRPASSEINDNGEPADRLTDELLNTAFVRMQATLIASGAGHISSSVNTLLRVSDHLKRCLRRCSSTSGDWRDARR